MKNSSKKRRILMVIIILLVLFPVTWLGYVSALSKNNETACYKVSTVSVESGYVENELLQSVLDNYSSQNGNVGLQATVIFPDNTIWSGTAGYANRSDQCLLTRNHHLYIGSITKLYTASMIMVEVERGTLSLSDTLDKNFDFPYAEKVMVGMLLNHTSGIPNYTESAWFLTRYFGLPQKEWHPNELVEVIGNKELKFEPGSQHEYSNSNYIILGVVLERVTGKTYGMLLQEMVGGESGSQDTFFSPMPHDIVVANGYDEALLRLGTRNLSGFRRSFESGAFSAGGILSTSDDVALFVYSLFTGKIVSPPTLDKMKEYVEAPDIDVPLQQGYGFGIRNLAIDGENLVGHTGTIPGYSGIAMYNEGKNYTIVILSNLSVIEQTQLFAEIQQVALQELP